MLYDIGRAMTDIGDLKQLLGFILEQAIKVTKAEKGSIMLFDPKTGALHLRVIEGLADKEQQDKINNYEIKTQTFKPGEGVAGRAFETGLPQVLNDTGNTDQFVRPGQSFTQSIVCIPMKVYNEPIGVINLTNKTDSTGFTEEDIEMLQAITDQAALAVNKAQLYEQAVTDSLTGLYIRRYFLAKLADELNRSERYQTPFSVVLSDVDKFKNVNDNYGHPVGDIVLKAVAKNLQDRVREVDVVARYGGEEFILMLPQTEKEQAMLLANRLRETIQNYSVDGVPPVTISLGVSSFPEDGNDMQLLVQKADSALYHAKETGRNKVVVYSDEIGLKKAFEDKESNGDKELLEESI